MKAAIKVTGIKELRVELRNLADRVPNSARGQMRRSAARIVEEAKLNTPVDDRLLEESIRIIRDYGIRGRLEIDIVAGGDTVMNPDGRMVNLDQYATLIHENYEAYNPGKETLAKMAAHPERIIGSRFLTRAAEAEEKKLERSMIGVIERDINEVMG